MVQIAKNSEAFLEWMRDENLAPKPSDPVLSPPAKRKSDASDSTDRVRDAELARYRPECGVTRTGGFELQRGARQEQ